MEVRVGEKHSEGRKWLLSCEGLQQSERKAWRKEQLLAAVTQQPVADMNKG